MEIYESLFASDDIRIPEEVIHVVRYDAEQEPYPLCVKPKDFPIVKEFLTEFLTKYKQITPITNRAESGEVLEFRFGSVVPNANHLLRQLFTLDFDEGPQAPGPLPVNDKEGSKVQVYREYPWHLLVNIGDHFIVKNLAPASVAAVAHIQSKLLDKTLRTCKVGNLGTMIIVVDGPGLTHKVVVDRGMWK